MDYISYLHLIGQVVFGLYFIRAGVMHFMESKMLAGYAGSKGVPAPEVAVIGSGVLAFLGGLGILLGLYPQVAALLLVIFLVPITFMMHAYWKDTDPQMKMNNSIQFYKNLALLAAVFLMF